MPRAPFLLALLVAAAPVVVLACSFDDKHEKYPDPADPSRPMVQSDRDPTASQPGVVPGYQAADPGAASSHWSTGGVEAGAPASSGGSTGSAPSGTAALKSPPTPGMSGPKGGSPVGGPHGAAPTGGAGAASPGAAPGK